MPNKVFLYLIVSIFCFGSMAQENAPGVSSMYSPEATGKLNISHRDRDVKFMCQEIPVNNGVFELCDGNSLPEFQFFIKRDVVDSNWLFNVSRQYRFFPDVSAAESNSAWFNFEERGNYHRKEDFISKDQKAGVTYKHHESRKNIVAYNMANPNGKAYSDPDKYHFQYDWEEKIKGSYEAFYPDGKRRFRHKYLIDRFMVLNENVSGTRGKSSMDINLTGTIEQYHENGKKKVLITYTDVYSIGKSDGKEREIKKATRTGEKTVYYESGKPFSKGKFDMKGMEGKLEYYSPKGIVIKIEVYKDGRKDGKVEEYYLDGSVKLKGEFELGKKSGVWITYDQNGKKTSTTKL